MSDVATTSETDRPHAPQSSTLKWYRAIAVGISLAFLIFGAKAFWANHFWLKDSDFVSFWAAGRLALIGKASLAYDIAAHHGAEQAAGNVLGLLPFPYPPPFLAVVAPFALLPFGPSYFVWIVATAALFAWASRRVASPAYAFAMPPAYINMLAGQNGFLISGIFIGGISLVESNPWLAGAMLGLMILKPQLALLLPIAMLAGREWRVIAGAALSASALLLAGLLLFGWRSYLAFFNILPHYVEFIRQGIWSWNKLASPFALGRFAGLSQTAALSIHVAVAIAATLVTARAWWLKLDARGPILAAATILIPPYLFTYDALLLTLPFAWLIRDSRHRWVAAIIWLLCLSPLLNHFTSLVWPNLVAVAAAICLLVLHIGARPARAARETSLDSQAVRADVSLAL